MPLPAATARIPVPKFSRSDIRSTALFCGVTLDARRRR